MEGHP
jgi:putative transposase